MQTRHSLAIVGALAVLCLCPAAQAQCETWDVCGSDTEYDYDANIVWAYSFTLNWYNSTTVSVAASFSTPADTYNEYTDDCCYAEVDFGVNDGDGDYQIEGTHYQDGGEWLIGSTSASTWVSHNFPTGDTTSFSGWDGAGTGMWMQQLITNCSYVGVAVTETDQGGDRDDTCFDKTPNSKYLALTSITGGLWTIGWDDTWGADHVGYFGQVAQYYHDQGVAPCGCHFPQQMQINVQPGDNGWVNYGPVNSLGSNLDATTVTSIRAGQSSPPRNY